MLAVVIPAVVVGEHERACGLCGFGGKQRVFRYQQKGGEYHESVFHVLLDIESGRELKNSSSSDTSAMVRAAPIMNNQSGCETGWATTLIKAASRQIALQRVDTRMVPRDRAKQLPEIAD